MALHIYQYNITIFYQLRLDIIKMIDKYITNLALRFSEKPIWKSIIILFFIITACSLVSVCFLLLGYDMKGPNTFLAKMSFINGFLFACILSPILETGLLYILILLTKKYLTKSITIQIFLPGIIFGSLHTYSLLYMIYAILAGIVFCFGFCSYYYNRGFKTAFWSITLIHLLRNALPFLLRLI